MNAPGETQSFVHVGTNGVNLATGLVFDMMQLVYELTSYAPNASGGGTEPNPGTTLSGLLPIFGAPDALSGISYSLVDPVDPAAVPEPGTIFLMGAGLAALVYRRRQLARR
jgi:hypothetical protein